MAAPAAPPLLSLERLYVRYPVRRDWLGRATAWRDALRGVSFPIAAGETLALVGESGSGKSTVARALLRLAPVASGRALLPDGSCVFALAGEGLRAWRRTVQMIHQDPHASLDPRYRAIDAVAEPLLIAGARAGAARRRAGELLERVGFRPGDFDRFPHELSGGQRQRVGIARALCPSPRLLIGDEPVSALDVSIQAQILVLLDELKRELSLTVLFISHDLAVVRSVADRVAVLYAGRVVEYGPAEPLFGSPLHPYTRELLDAVPVIGRPETPPRPQGSPAGPGGCPFAPRCARRAGECDRREPALLEHLPGRAAACHFPDVPAGASVSHEPEAPRCA